MKTFITVSVMKKDKEELEKIEIDQIYDVVHNALELIKTGLQVQLKITNLPLIREET